MNVQQLKEQVDAALAAGLHPETEVVYARDGWYELIDPVVEHPVDDSGNIYLWFTLSPALDPTGLPIEADARFTPPHSPVPDPELHAEYLNLVENLVYLCGYPEWLEAEFIDCSGALRDDPPRDPQALAGTYRRLAALLDERERFT